MENSHRVAAGFVQKSAHMSLGFTLYGSCGEQRSRHHTRPETLYWFAAYLASREAQTIERLATR